MKNKNRNFLIVAIAWFVLISGVVAQKEYRLRTGVPILLHTVPVDPRDLFRGDYVTLRYDISSLHVYDSAIDMGDTVYVPVEIDASGYAHALGVSKARPLDGLYLAGTVTLVTSNSYDRTVQIKYGLEEFFVPEKQGWSIPTRDGRLSAMVKVDDKGHAMLDHLVLDGHALKFK